MKLQKAGYFLLVLLLFAVTLAVSAADGSIWTRATTNAQYGLRYNHASAVFDNKMWVIGGYGNSANSGLYSDVWSSTDGQVWTQATSYAFTPRRYMASTDYNSNMWVFGGLDNSSGGGYKNDVWHSADGTNWYRSTANAGWTPRFSSAAVSYNNLMWVMGGNDWSYVRQNDVWYSSDGVTWSQRTASAAWPARRDFTATVYDEKMWVMGGYGSTGICMMSGILPTA